MSESMLEAASVFVYCRFIAELLSSADQCFAGELGIAFHS